MNSLRTLFTYGVLTFITLGYLASQWAYLNGRFAEYARAVDTPAIKIMSLAIFIGAVALAFLPDRGGETN
jgi:hypothetical protein